MKKYIIGIDPDVTQSGVAVLNTETKELKLCNCDFGRLVCYLQGWRELDAVVVVEAGWLNRSNWHTRRGDSPRVISEKGRAVGRNQQIGLDIVELCKVYGLEVEEKPPLAKCWKGHDRKITHEEFAAFTHINRGRINQEERDAGLLAWDFAGFPIRIYNYKAK